MSSSNVNDSVYGCVIASPFRPTMIVSMLGNLLLLIIAIGVLLVAIAQARRLLATSSCDNVSTLNRTNALALFLGWIGLGIGSLLFWNGFCYTCNQLSDALQKGVEIDVVLMVLLTSLRGEVRPMVFGFSILVFVYCQIAFVNWRLARRA